jgi:flagellar hook-associated protein 2
MTNMLAKLASSVLTSDGPYKTLNDIGVTTNRDGTLALNKDALNKALTDNPEAVVQMLNPTTRDATHLGIDGALKNISDYLNGTDGPLSASSAIYDNLGKTYTKQMTKLTDGKSSYSDRLTKT